MTGRLALLLVLCWPALAWTQAGTPAVDYRIDAGRSEILIYTGRGGWLSALGHRHVLAVKRLTGTLTLAADPRQSSARLSIPVAAIEIDAPTRRAAAGDGVNG